MKTTREKRQASIQAMTDAELLDLYLERWDTPFYQLTDEVRNEARILREEVLARMAGRMAVV